MHCHSRRARSEARGCGIRKGVTLHSSQVTGSVGAVGTHPQRLGLRVLWPKSLDLRLERGFDRPVRRLNGNHARPNIGDTARLADALDLRTLLREFAGA